jgi:arginine exporter protein ArgO
MDLVVRILVGMSIVIFIGLLGGGYRLISKWVFGGRTTIVKFIGYCLFGSHLILFMTHFNNDGKDFITFMIALSILIGYLGLYYMGVEILRDITRKRYRDKNGRNN